MIRNATRALLPFVLVVPAREAARSLGLLLHTGLQAESPLGETLHLMEPGRVLNGELLALVLGSFLWILLAFERARRGLAFRDALAQEAPTFELLYLFPAITILAVLSVSVRPAFPFAWTLPIALSQDLEPALFVAVLAGIAALRYPSSSLPSPSAGEVFFLSFLAYASLSPSGDLSWNAHTGNEPKYLRMASSLGLRLSLDVDPETSLPDEADVLLSAPSRAFFPSAVEAARCLLSNSSEMLRAIVKGRGAWRREAIQAERLGRQTLRGRDGGVYYVLAPGPSAVLAPLLRLDRALSALRRTPGRIPLTLLAWNGLAALLAASLFVFLRDLTGKTGVAAVTALFASLTPPFLFFSYQFYPEPLAALVLVIVLRFLLLRRRWKPREALFMGLLVAFLPWLHQKFLVVWIVLAVVCLVRAVDELVYLGSFLAILVPQLVSFYLTLLYNFAITGSPRPDAVFVAWGFGVGSTHIGGGVLGLLFDMRYGLLPSVPIYFLALAGFLLGKRRLLPTLLPFFAYYLTVAAADNWSGSICNLGRFILPVTPVLVAGIALALCLSSRGVSAIALALAGFTGLLTEALWRDPRAANDSDLLFSKSAYADANLYFPNLFFRSWNYGQPGQAVRVLVVLTLTALLSLWLLRAASGRGGRSATRAIVGLVGVALLASSLLERWPSSLRAPRFPNALRLDRVATAYLTGPVRLEEDHVRIGSGHVEILVSSGNPLEELLVSVRGRGSLRIPGDFSEKGRLPLERLRTIEGRGGRHETLSRQSFDVETSSEVEVWFRTSPP